MRQRKGRSVMELNGVTSRIDNSPDIVDANFDNSKMEQSDFLKVLLADIQWQNPLEAKDVSDFINNSVKLREMEVLNNFETAIDALQSANSSGALLQASSLIDKKISYEGNLTHIEGGKGVAEFKLDSNADLVKVTVLDGNGAIVESRTFTDLQGQMTYPFEINDQSLDDGYYALHIEATKQGDPVGSATYSRAVVEGIVKREGSLMAYFGNKEIDIDNITQIGG